MSKNPNHPKKGSRITVDPIRNEKDIKTIGRMLQTSPRDHLLFIMGINNGLRTGDLLRLKVKDVMDLKAGDVIKIRESKTGKDNVLAINKTVFKVLRTYLDTVKPNPDHYLFKSKKGENKSISISAVNLKIKKWTSAINLRGNYGAHSLRKTWGYIQRTNFGVGFEVICKRFNHASPATSMAYLGIENKEVESILLNNEIG